MAAKKAEEEKKKAMKAKREPLTKNLKSAITRNSGKYLRPIELSTFSVGVKSLDLDDLEVFNELCTVIAISIVEGSIQLMALVNKVKDFRESKMDADTKERFLIELLKAMKEKLNGDIEAYN